MNLLRTILAALTLCVTLSACGTPMAEVSGTVYVDDQILKEGEIIFQEVDNSKAPVSNKIIDGKYSLKMVPGSKRIQIKASRPTAKPDPVMGTAAREAMIAEEFNERTTLKMDVTTGKHDNVDFKVKSILRDP